MSEIRLIDANALKKWIDESLQLYGNRYSTDMLNMFGLFREVIDNAPTVELERVKNELNNELNELKPERPQGECKTCKYYHPYYEQFSNKPRGDGYCVIARMSPEGMTTINCNDEFGCSDYMKGGAEE